MNQKTMRTLEFDKIKETLKTYAVSSLGAELVEALEPSVNLHEIQEWQQETTEASDLILKKGSIPLGGLSDIRLLLKKAARGIALQPRELLSILDVLRLSRRMKDYIHDDRGESHYPIFEEFGSHLTTFRQLEEKINTTIAGEDEINDGASSKLLSIRKRKKEKNGAIKEKLNHMISSATYQKYLQDPIVTMRGDRYVIPVKQEYRGNVPGLIHDQSASGITLFIEPMAVVEMNNDLKQLQLDEEKEIERILLELTALVEEKNDLINVDMEILATIDFIAAKANYGLEFRCTEPEMNLKGVVNIKKARHPLINPKTVVPIDIYLGEQFYSLIITGPNTGGKTVTLKTLGLLTLMAQAGLHIPAGDHSEVAVFENILADIGDEQSIEQSLSTFSSHMRNIVNILNEDLNNSLVLFDELGAGTDPTEGAALAMSILERLHKRSVRTVATTHYPELKTYALTTPGVCNACMEFDVETLRPTYRLIIGLPGKSNAFEISRKLGLTNDIIDRAKDFLSGENIAFEDVVADLQQKLKETQEEYEVTHRLREEVEFLKKELSEKNTKLQAQRDKILFEAQNQALNTVRQAKEEAELLILELRVAMEEEEAKKKQEAIDNVRTRSKSLEEGMEEKIGASVFQKKAHTPPKKVKLGDSVLVVNLNQRGTVSSLPDAEGNLVVKAGIMKINTNLSQLELVREEKKVEKKRGTTHKIASEKISSIHAEIDVRGQTVDEAMLNVDKYIDDAYLAGMNQIRIIHGKGTGALRAGIVQFLRSNRYVKSYRAGVHGEGDTGVTVVELKK